MKTYAVYDKEDCPIVVGSSLFCSQKLGVTERTFKNILVNTSRKRKKRSFKPSKYNIYFVDRDDEKLDTYLIDHHKWPYPSSGVNKISGGKPMLSNAP